jgi:hypothetical protein
MKTRAAVTRSPRNAGRIPSFRTSTRARILGSFIPAQYARVCDGVIQTKGRGNDEETTMRGQNAAGNGMFGFGNLEYPKPAVHPL